MMFFIPPAILAIEDEDDRSFMENLYRSYYRLMYHEIFTVTSDPWLAEDIPHSQNESGNERENAA